MARIGFRMRMARPMAVAASLALLSLPSIPTPAVAADDKTLTVAVDESFYLAQDMALLADQVREAARSETNRISMGTTAEGFTVTIHDLKRDKKFAEDVEAQFADSQKFTTRKSAALSFQVEYSPDALKAHGPEKLTQDFNQLEDFVQRLRTPLPDILIAGQADGAIVRSNDPSFEKVLRKTLGAMFIVTPLTKTSWTVALNNDLMPRRLHPIGKLRTPEILRQFLGDPLDLSVEPDYPGIQITVPNPNLHQSFIANVRNVFAHNPDFVLTESEALILEIIPKDIANSPTGKSTLHPLILPPKVGFDAIDELYNLADPPIEIAVAGNAILFRAQDASHNADRAAIIRRAFANRTDLVITTQPDLSLSISLAPGAHIAPPAAPLRPGQLKHAVESRISTLKLRSAGIRADSTDRVRVRFATSTDATAFRRAISDRFGLSIRLVDEAQTGEAAATAPSFGDEKLPYAPEGFVWVKPGTIISGSMIADASVGTNATTKEPIVKLRFTEEGRKLFAAATRVNVGRRLATVQDGVMVSAPVVREPIEGGKVEISGNFTPESANALVRSITARKDDLPLKILDER
jgi:preprotein translocase subunit SecD